MAGRSRRDEARQGGAWLGEVTQTSKIVRKLCGGKTNGLFLEEDEAADYG